MKPSELKQVLDKTIPAGRPILIVGPPGVGKSDIVAQACAETGAALLVSHPVVSDPTDYKGLPGIVNGKAEFLPFGDLRTLISPAGRTVCFLDDLGQAPPVVQAAAMQLILARRVNGHTVSDEVTFVAATNRREDKAGVTGILEPVKSRFATIIHLEPDLEDWCTWALGHGMPPELVAFIRFRPNLLHDFKPTSDMVNTPCPRTVANAGALLSLGFMDHDVIAGAAGEGFAAELMAFLKVWRKMPSPAAVLMDPDAGEIPDDPATLYALCGALAARASDQTAENLMRYAMRLSEAGNIEFSVLLVRDATRRFDGVVNCAAGVKWISRHKNVLV